MFRSTAALVLAIAAPLAISEVRGQEPVYPEARRSDHVDVYHGVSVPDPYRWLEDTDSPETRAWIEAESALTFGYLEAIAEREAIRERVTELWDYERWEAPFREAGRYFFFKNDGLQNQSVLYRAPALDAPPSPLLDPNALAADGTISLGALEVSPDGRYLAYGLQTAGSDWVEFQVREIGSGKDLPDRVQWAKFSGVSWTGDGRGFFYSRYPEPVEGRALTGAVRNQKLYYHVLGTPQSEDRLVYERPDRPEWGFGAEVTEDGRYAVVHVWHGTDPRNRLYAIDLGDSAQPDLAAPVRPLIDEADAAYEFIGNVGPVFYLRTDLDAPRGRIVAVDTREPERSAWREIVPESDRTLESAILASGRLVLRYLEDAKSRLLVFDLDGTPDKEIALPGIGTVSQLRGEPDSPEIFFAFSSFTKPTAIHRHDLATGETTVWKAPELRFDPSRYEIRQAFYHSKDGTRIPMFLVHAKGIAEDGGNPTYLYGYGGFNISITPFFWVSNLVWLEMGGVLAVANLRGGNEYGEEWHQAGIKANKQNVFDDFIAAADYLIQEGITSPGRLVIGGHSNGGLLVGAAMTQRPDLFAVALPAVGVMDMLRYHEFTIGWAWASDYGTSEDPEMFEVLRAYSPLHNLEPGVCYPATLVTTADHDDRVVPGHSFKFAATLQAAQGCDRPTLIRIETKAGHGGETPTAKQIEEATDLWTFAVHELGITPVGLARSAGGP
ncbi:MAG: prolyl oligopeptidase family serine peptidase [Gemmatimonadota bacterium]